MNNNNNNNSNEVPQSAAEIRRALHETIARDRRRLQEQQQQQQLRNRNMIQQGGGGLQVFPVQGQQYGNSSSIDDGGLQMIKDFFWSKYGVGLLFATATFLLLWLKNPYFVWNTRPNLETPTPNMKRIFFLSLLVFLLTAFGPNLISVFKSK